MRSALRHLAAIRVVSHASGIARATVAQGHLLAAGGLALAHAGASTYRAVSGDQLDPLCASWANVFQHGRLQTLLLSQVLHESIGHLAACSLSFGVSAAFLGAARACTPASFLCGTILSGTAGACAGLASGALAHAPAEALPILLGRGEQPVPPRAARPDAADGVLVEEPYADAYAARAALRRKLDRVGPTARVRDFHEYLAERDAQLRLGVIDGVDRRADIPTLVTLYRPYKRWMEWSVTSATPNGSGAAAALGSAAVLLVRAWRSAGSAGAAIASAGVVAAATGTGAADVAAMAAGGGAGLAWAGLGLAVRRLRCG